MDRIDSGDWARHNQLTKPLAFSHALSRIFPPELYEKHPEFFPLVDGKRLKPPTSGPTFWNPDLGREDVARHAANAARAYFDSHPDEESFALGVNDALIWGESPENLALVTPTQWFRERPDYSPLVFTFMNRVADELAKTHPNKLLGSLAYYFCENTPPFPVRSNVVPFLTADRSQGYDAKFREEEFRLREKWARSGVKRLGMYDYVYGSGFLIPRIHTQLLAENVRHAQSVGFTDYFAEVNPNWGLDGPMPWLLAQLLRDPEQSRESLLDEYYRRCFREAAVPMRRFFELCESQWIKQPGPSYWLKHYRNDSQADVFPAAVCRELRHSLDEASRLAQSSIVRGRVQLVQKAFGVTERFVAFQEARDRLSRSVLSAKTTSPALVDELGAFLKARGEFKGYVEALRIEAPLAVAPFGWDDYLKNDPTSAALLKIDRISASSDARASSTKAIVRLNEPVVSALWSALGTTKGLSVVERNGSMVGPQLQARRIAGLDYGLSLPSEWSSEVEPSQYFRVTSRSDGERRLVRIEGTKDTMISQWDPVSRRGLHRASVVVSGHVSSGTAISVMMSWLDAQNRHVGFTFFRLPEGDWPTPVKLDVASLAPDSAVWVGIGFRIQHQVKGDWIEVGDFQLRAN